MYQPLHKEEKGFTLVELIVVIVILAVLIGIAIPSYLAMRNRARTQSTRSEMKTIATAISMYEADRNRFPEGTTLKDLIIALEGTDDTGADVYIENCPTEDGWEAEYTYKGKKESYTLTSTAGTPERLSDDIVITDGEFTVKLEAMSLSIKRWQDD